MARRLQRLRSPAGMLLVGKATNTVSQGLMVVVVGRLLGASAVGLYTLGLAIVSPVFLLAHMRIQDVLGVDQRAASRWSEHLAVLVMSSVLAGVVCVIAAALIPTNGASATVAALVVVNAVQSMMFACHGIWLGEGKRTRVTASYLIRAVGQPLVLVIGILWGNLVWGLILVGVFSAIVLLLYDLPRSPRFTLAEIRPIPLMALAATLAPLGLGAFLISSNQSVVRLLLESNLGTAALGTFAATAYLVRLGSVVAQSIGSASAPQYRSAREEHDPRGFLKASWRASTSAVAMGVILLLAGALVGAEVVTAIYGADFTPTRWLVISVFVAGVPLYASTALAVPAVAVGYHRRFLAISAAGLAVTVVGALLLIPACGIYGAATAWALGELARFVGLVWHVRAGSSGLTVPRSVGPTPPLA